MKREDTCEYEWGMSIKSESRLLASEDFHAICHALFMCDVTVPACAFSTWTDVGKRGSCGHAHRASGEGQRSTRYKRADRGVISGGCAVRYPLVKEYGLCVGLLRDGRL